MPRPSACTCRQRPRPTPLLPRQLPQADAILPRLRRLLRKAPCSVATHLHPRHALALQHRFGCEFAYDHVIDLASRRTFGLATRGFPGGVLSDALCHYLLSRGFRVLPGYHTHQAPCSELGRHMPSLADFRALGLAQCDLGGQRHQRPPPPPPSRRGLSICRAQPSAADCPPNLPFSMLPDWCDQPHFQALTRCPRRLQARVYFPDGHHVDYALRRDGTGLVRFGHSPQWRPAWDWTPDNTGRLRPVARRGCCLCR